MSQEVGRVKSGPRGLQIGWLQGRTEKEEERAGSNDAVGGGGGGTLGVFFLLTSEEIFLLGLPFKCLHAHENWAGSPFGTHFFSSDRADLLVWGLRPII